MLRRYYQQMNLKKKVRIYFLCMTMIWLMLIILALRSLISQSTNKYLTESSRKMTVGSAENLHAVFESTSNMGRLILDNSSVQKYLETSRHQYDREAISQIKEISAFFPDFHSIFVIRDSGQYISYSQDITRVDVDNLFDDDWKKILDERQGGYVVRLNGGGIFSTKQEENLVSFMRKLYHPETQKPVGYLVINLSGRMLEETCLNRGTENASYLLADLEGRTLGVGQYDTDLSIPMQHQKEYEQQVEQSLTGLQVTSYTSCANDSLFIRVKDEVSFFSLLRGQINYIWIAFMAFSILGFIFIGKFITKSITHPIEELCNSMEKVKNGYFYRVSMKLPNDEIGILKNTYNNMLVETNRLINEVIEQEKKIQNAELAVLQEQINPHFLYNTLETICYMILEKQKLEVYDAVETLGNFYRKFLSNGKTTILLEEELQIVQDYLVLQKLRYQDVFEVHYEIPERVPQVMVPKLILQPLVENAIYHGLRPKGEKGTIKIRVCEETEFVRVEVWDNGVGMTEEELENLEKRENGKSFGFKGTVERLHYYFKTDEVCKVYSEKDSFFQVVIQIPKEGGRLCTGS